MGSGDNDLLVKAKRGDGKLNGGHGGNQGLNEDGVVAGEDLIVDADGDDLCFWVGRV